jgi:hypothetical protein
MLSQLLRGLRRLRITAPLAVFDKGRPPTEAELDHLQQYLRERDQRERQAIREFLTRVKRDRELDGILRFYGVGEEQVNGIISLLCNSAVPVQDGFGVPFVLEACAYRLSHNELSGDTHFVIWSAYKSADFIDDAQRQRFREIFAAQC